MSVSQHQDSSNAPTTSMSSLNLEPDPSSRASSITYRAYKGEQDLEHIVALVDDELSEPYNLYTYRYFLDEWPHLCFFAFSGETPVGVIISKLEPHSKSSTLVPVPDPETERIWTDQAAGGSTVQDPITGVRKRYRMRGYLAMLSVRKDSRGKGIATHLLRLSLTTMLDPPKTFLSTVPIPHPSHWQCSIPDEFVLETESDNREALGFYEKMGFVREKELYRFYLNGKRAARLKLDLRGMGLDEARLGNPPRLERQVNVTMEDKYS
ncbi:peptide alpha-N-acetyltransferase MAK3 [Sporobolomyces koalae]|uniref:peptide alpha-N-acetyltransferase MAK3 n=1 Tax=Sporobolomyces koalae TaxID=500713 RepID=UPI00316DA6F4